MEGIDRLNIECPGCAAAYRWGAKLANHKVQCRCGMLFRMPATAGDKAIAIEQHRPTLEKLEPSKPVTIAPASNPDADDELMRLEADDLDLLTKNTEQYELTVPQEIEADAPPPTPPSPDHAGAPGATSESEPVAKYTRTGNRAISLDDPALDDLHEQQHAVPPPVAPGVALKVQPLSGNRCPSCGLSLKPGGVVCLNCGFNLVTGTKAQTQVIAAPHDADDEAKPAGKPGVAAAPGSEVHAAMLERAARAAEQRAKEDADRAKRDRFTEYYLPLILIVVGLALLLLNAGAFMWIEKPPKGAVPGAVAPGIGIITALPPPTPPPAHIQRIKRLAFDGVLIVLRLPFLVLGLLIVAKLFGSSYGNLGPVLLKLTAITLVTHGVDNCIDSLILQLSDGISVPGGGLVSLSIAFGVFLSMCMWLLDMDVQEVIALYASTVVLPLIALVVAISLFM